MRVAWERTSGQYQSRKAPKTLMPCIGTMNRSVGTPIVWSPAFRRSGPAKAGTPNGRFMESLLSFFRMHWDHEPTPNPSQEGKGQDADECLLPSREGSGVGRFREGVCVRAHRVHGECAAQPAAGWGISRSTISNAPPGRAICAARIFGRNNFWFCGKRRVRIWHNSAPWQTANAKDEVQPQLHAALKQGRRKPKPYRGER